MKTGTFEQLGKDNLKTWTGWAMYFWDHSYNVVLFQGEPKKDSGGWFFGGGIEGISPYFLRACGIDVAFDKGDKSHENAVEFYYGEESSDGRGQHNPIQITLILPKTLLEQLNLI